MKKINFKNTILLVAACLISATLLSCRGIVKKFDIDISYDYPERFSVGNFTTTSQVRDIEIDWIDGSIILEASETDTLTVTESSDKPLTDTNSLHWYLGNNGTLHLKYAKSSKKLSHKDFKGLNKVLTVRVPRTMTLEDISVDGVSTKLNVKDVHCNELSIDGVDVTLEGVFEQVPKDIDIEGVDVHVDAAFPEGTLVSVDIDGLSCDVTSDLPLCNEDMANCQISFDGVSCNVRVRTIQQPHSK